MAVQCTHCGATLMGAVNRCWQCGQAVSAATLVESEAEVAASMEHGVSEAGGSKDQSLPKSVTDMAALSDATQAGDPQADDDRGENVPSPGERQQPGSPFAQSETGRLKSAAAPAAYPQHLANSVGAVLAILLGAMALVEAPYVPVGAVFTALIGLACGVWGIKSNRRKSSTFGMVLCCVALTWGIFNAAVELYIYSTGNDPFAPNTVIETPGEEDEPVDPFNDPNF